MKRHTVHLLPLALLLATALLTSCHSKQEPTRTATEGIDYTKVSVPDFCADSAYQYVSDQLKFGNRTPGSKAWSACADYLVRQMSRWCDTVVVQHFKAELWDGTQVPGRNIIASINPAAPKRILLGAHWDSRLWADHDPDDNKHHQPVPGANDGASGVAALMEMARVMSQIPPSAGVDFIFFDVEDQGVPEWSEMYEDNSWCLGSQYWSQNRHLPYYTAVYGVLFDMVGTEHPRFTQEEVSLHYAPGLVNKLWDAAAATGYGSVFIKQKTGAILDDHLYVNQMTGIPMVDIVQNNPEGNFFTHWHTTTDDINAINPESMRIVATVTMKAIYGDYPAK